MTLEHAILQPVENGEPLCSCEYCDAAKRIIFRMRKTSAAPATKAKNTALLAAIKVAADTGAPLPEGAARRQKAVAEKPDMSFLDALPAGQRWQARVDYWAERVGARTYQGKRDQWTNL
ncbi:hypothetical protein C1N74_07670 [Microbacterium sp. SGAir0570]|uniref:hypothetical protein n=1 Tax=Microbacterium sp. SGAir0570 TaxID=2070348 RepID=UPI0010CD14CD|nr:hypothetical protein [Microbacterium sp. SGAir0570]QCR40311.1 hypothetical protein C1N74_07670 [Microbacterium sp. SGAir0570]